MLFYLKQNRNDIYYVKNDLLLIKFQILFLLMSQLNDQVYYYRLINNAQKFYDCNLIWLNNFSRINLGT